ncbi:MAG: YlbF family regulator [Lachnospiraceae bacterium]|nr:YlbF family regulator [Lachnospiraceae bacterium]
MEDGFADNSVRNATDQFVEAIKESEIYKEYHIQKEKIKRHPELFERVGEFRQRNYELQTSARGDDLLEKLDAFEREYEEFRANPLVDDFLRAELAFCRMMQRVNVRITAGLDFE